MRAEASRPAVDGPSCRADTMYNVMFWRMNAVGTFLIGEQGTR